MQALTTAEVDKVDLMQFQVLNNGDIVYERDIGPPPPLFEDPSIIKVRGSVSAKLWRKFVC